VTGKKDMRDRVKSLWIRGMKAVGNTAASIANNTRYKVDEVTIQNRRREVLGDLAQKAYALWLKGEAFPEEMNKMLEELKTLDEQLNDMRAEKYASSGKTYCPPEESSAEAEDSAEGDEGDDSFDLRVDSPVRTEINAFFDSDSSVGKTAEKVNQSLEQLSDRIRSFPQSEDPEDNGKRQD